MNRMMSRRRALTSLAAAPLVAAAAAALPSAARAHVYDDDGVLSGMVFTSSNDVAGNALLVFARGADGTLAPWLTLPTGGLGSGAGLGSQGAVTLSRSGRRLYVVNAGSHTVSAFTLAGGTITLDAVAPSGGLHPISVTEHDGLVVVLNDGGAGNIAALRDDGGSALQPLAGSSRPLSAAGGTAPAQVSFGSDGRVLIATEKATNRLLSWPVASGGQIGALTVSAAPGVTPFGFGVANNQRIVVSEAWGGAAGASTASAWRFDPQTGRAPRVTAGAVPNGQGAACWVAVTPDGRHAFVANTGSSTLSRYRLAADGGLTLVEAAAGSTGAGSAPADTAVSPNGRTVHVRNGRTGTIASFAIDGDGALRAPRFVSGLPASAVGLAAN